MKPPRTLRCSIYTRVSTEQGLEQEFNSLDNQREAAEAYIKSQAHEGWTCLAARYDDGGFSGGSMDRPALQQLLSDIRDRRLDIVVVYKVDRLTRSLADFAKLVEIMDAQDVSFVSVTQAFNTTNSMGRLTLNVLLSFAQFEREVTAERIRDKIAASKKKGMRMGGPVPLGYDLVSKKLMVNPAEADQVRLIFRRYLELGCFTKLIRNLEENRIFSKVRKRNGKSTGGITFAKGSLGYLLKNRTYIGEIGHKGQHYPGEHEAILDKELFEAVQRLLALGAQSRQSRRISTVSFLTGCIYDDRGNRMTPCTANKNGARYRYYVSAPLMQGRKELAGSVSRISAPDIEAVVIEALSQRLQAIELGGDESLTPTPLQPDQIRNALDRVTVRKDSLEIVTCGSAVSPTNESLTIPWAPQLATHRRDIVAPHSAEGFHPSKPIRSEARARLIDGIAKARQWVDELVSGFVKSTSQIAHREGCSERSIRMTLSLAFLGPDVVKAAIAGTLPRSVGLSRFVDVQVDWAKQGAAIDEPSGS